MRAPTTPFGSWATIPFRCRGLCRGAVQPGGDAPLHRHAQPVSAGRCRAPRRGLGRAPVLLRRAGEVARSDPADDRRAGGDAARDDARRRDAPRPAGSVGSAAVRRRRAVRSRSRALVRADVLPDVAEGLRRGPPGPRGSLAAEIVKTPVGAPAGASGRRHPRPPSGPDVLGLPRRAATSCEAADGPTGLRRSSRWTCQR